MYTHAIHTYIYIFSFLEDCTCKIIFLKSEVNNEIFGARSKKKHRNILNIDQEQENIN